MHPGLKADPAFVSILEQFSIERLEAELNPIFGLWSNLRVAYVNPAGERLVRAANPTLGEWGIGGSILPALPERLRFFYVEEFQRVLATSKLVTHLEEPASPGAPTRQVQVFPLWGSGLLISSALVVQEPAAGGDGRSLDADYRDENGFILECSYCRKFRRPGAPERWDWVTSFIERTPDRTTHGVCYLCFGYYSR